jgi:hypothetical protein
MNALCVIQLSLTVTNISEKGGKVSFASQFQRLLSTIAWPHPYGPMVRQSIMVKRG